MNTDAGRSRLRRPAAGIGPGALPEPPTTPPLGHLPQWAASPLRLLENGARTGPVFRLRLWRPVIAGYRPGWNRAVLTDTDTFRSRGSLSGLSPYLAAGIVHTDAPDHRPRRRALNKHFSAHALAALADRLASVAEGHQPSGTFDAAAWAADIAGDMLSTALFGGAVPGCLLRRFLRPLDRDLPIPLLPRPRLFRRTDRAIAGALTHCPPDSIAAHLLAAARAAGADPHPRDVVDDLRVALAAGYDTTSHTLAWAAWHLAAAPGWRDPQLLPLFLAEILRRYPAGWLGSRVASRDTTIAGVLIPAGTLVLYSPYLTHHDPSLWEDPHRFAPRRFESGYRSWAYLPYAAGPRTCLGMHLSQLMLRTALQSLCQRNLAQAGGDPGTAAGLTLRPRGPLLVHASPRTAAGAVGRAGDQRAVSG